MITLKVIEHFERMGRAPLGRGVRVRHRDKSWQIGIITSNVVDKCYFHVRWVNLPGIHYDTVEHKNELVRA